jgi:mannosyltransferase OCH1-like enzyme
MPSFLAENAQKLMHLNEGWAYRLYDDVACARFIKENYDLAIFKRYQSIHQDYGAARADFFRYLLIYKVGGVYLDIKSGCDIPFDTFLTAEDEYLLSHWRDPQWGYHAQFGVEAEFQQWHIMARPGHPFLAAVIEKISENISNYDPITHGVGKHAVINMTGPIAYTKAILPIIRYHSHRIIEAEGAGLIYSIAPIRHDRIFKKHYSKVTRPLVGFRYIQKNYFSMRIFAIFIIYLNSRFYKFLRTTKKNMFGKD